MIPRVPVLPPYLPSSHCIKAVAHAQASELVALVYLHCFHRFHIGQIVNSDDRCGVLAYDRITTMGRNLFVHVR